MYRDGKVLGMTFVTACNLLGEMKTFFEKGTWRKDTFVLEFFSFVRHFLNM